jgi:hypothetical protein
MVFIWLKQGKQLSMDHLPLTTLSSLQTWHLSPTPPHLLGWGCCWGCWFSFPFPKWQHLYNPLICVSLFPPKTLSGLLPNYLVKCLCIKSWGRQLGDLPCNYPVQLEDKVSTNRFGGGLPLQTQMWSHTWFSKQHTARPGRWQRVEEDSHCFGWLPTFQSVSPVFQTLKCLINFV